jgi:hypothetical protein
MNRVSVKAPRVQLSKIRTPSRASCDSQTSIYFADFLVNAVMSGMPAARAASTMATTVP